MAGQPDRLQPPGDRPSGVDDAASSYRKAQPYIDASWQLVGAVGLGSFAGWWADKKFGTNPWLLVTGSLVGIGVGFYAFFKAILRLGKKP